MKKILRVLVSIIIACSCLATSVQASVIFSDDFSIGTLDQSTFRQNDLGNGLWHHAGAWSNAGGILLASGDTDVASESEGGLIRAEAVGSATGTTLRVTFDYTLAAAGESLYVFLYGTTTNTGFNAAGIARMANHGHAGGRIQYLESVDGQDPALVSSVEFVGGLTISESAPTSYLGPGGQYPEFALISGGTSGTFEQEVDLSQWGLAVEDFDYITVGFARDAVVGSEVTIDNVVLDAPPPSATVIMLK